MPSPLAVPDGYTTRPLTMADAPTVTALVAAEMLGEYPTQIVVLFSAHLDPNIRAAARNLGVSACVSKQDVTKLPGILDDLVAAS